MSSRGKLLIVAGVLVVLGIVLIALQPGPPKGECARPGGPTSGFTQNGCPISIASYHAIRDDDSSPKVLRIAGVVVILLGLATAGAAAPRRPRRTDSATRE